MKLFIFPLFAVLSITAHSQSYFVSNQKTLGGSFIDYNPSVVVNNDNSVLVFGSTFSEVSGDLTLPRLGMFGTDGWLVKLSSDYSIDWQEHYGGDSYDDMTEIIPTRDDNYLLAGASASSVSEIKTVETNGNFDTWLVKIDADGNSLAQYGYGGADDEYFGEIIELDDGSFLMGATSFSDISGDKTEAAFGLGDFWIVKIDAEGEVLWDRTLGGSGEESFLDIIELEDGSVIVCGASNSDISGNKSEDSYGNKDFWVVKLDANGNILWDRTYGGSGLDIANALSQSGENILIGGTSESNISAVKSENSLGGLDLWVLKVDPDGNIIWDKTLGGDDTDSGNDVLKKSDNEFVFAGSSRSGVGTYKSEGNNGEGDMWVIAIDSSGNHLWDKTVGGSGQESVRQIEKKGENDLVLVAASKSGISGDKSETNRGDNDFWVVELSSTASITDELQQGIAKLYPNPATTNVTFELQANIQIRTAELYDLDGRLVKNIPGDNAVLNMDVSNLNAGLYTFRLTTLEGETHIGKLVIN